MYERGDTRGARQLILAGLAIAGLAGCGGDAIGEVSPASDAKARSDARSGRGAGEQKLLLTGELRAVNSRDLMVPRVPGWRTTIRWMPDDGVRIAAGERVLELDNSSYVSELEEAKLAVVSAGSALVRARADAATAHAEKEFAVRKAALELRKAKLEADIPEKLLSVREYQERQLERERKETALEKATEDLSAQSAEAAAEEANLDLDLEKALREREGAEFGIQTMSLTAPRDGMVLVADHPWEKRKLRIGDTVFVGWSVASLPDLSSMRVEARLFDVDDGLVEVGMKAEVVLDGHPGITYDATVVEIPSLADVTEANSLRRAFKILLDIETTDTDRMRPGMSAKVVITTSRRIASSTADGEGA